VLEKEFSWDGICIEANPLLFERLTMARSCACIHSCVDCVSNREIEFYFQESALALGGIISEDTDNRNPDAKGRRVTMVTKTLTQILDENNAPKVMDYLSLDVEGAELRVFEGFDFGKYRFLAMTIERPSPELNKLLFANDYIFVRNSTKLKFDSFYVHRCINNFDEIEKYAFEQVPGKF
jgi:FkbM family methyltransferase